MKNILIIWKTFLLSLLNELLLLTKGGVFDVRKKKMESLE